MKPQWVLATNNLHKLEEVRAILEHKIDILSLSDIGCEANPIENGSTFSANAFIKAKEISLYTDLPVLADDSGLCVNALNGSPGVISARYAGDNASDSENVIKLLSELSGTTDRSAYFTTSLCLLIPGSQPQFFEGFIHGAIAEVPSGSNGFGYDPVFIPAGGLNTFAEMTASEKNANSHRADALQQLFLKLFVS